METPKTTPRRRIGKYEIGHDLGSGSFGVVRAATNMDTGESVAIKTVDKHLLVEQNLESQFLREVEVMKLLKHDNIVELKQVMQTETKIFIVMELVTGGDLFRKIVTSKKFDEATARHYFRQLINAVQCCHSSGIAHRDIKPENILLDEKGNVKVADFGLANFQRDGELMKTVCGTHRYAAPEVLGEENYDGKQADMWSCLLLFAMVAGASHLNPTTPSR